MSEKQIQSKTSEDFWNAFLTRGEHVTERRWRNIFKHLPDDPRCKMCYSPFSGIGGTMMKVINRGPSNITTKMCDY
jgi:adenylate cyclase